MNEMKTLTVNGVTYTVSDPDAAHIQDATISSDGTWSSQKISQEIAGAGGGGSGNPYGVMYIPQELTEEQKAQARENIDVPSYQEHEEDILALDARVDELEKGGGTGGGAEEKWELINAITITEENTRVAVFDDNFCLKKFVIKAYFAGVSGQTTRNITFSMMEKLDNGSYQVFYNDANLSAIVDNSPRYFTVWGEAIVGVPMMLYMSRVGQYPDKSTVMETVQSPNVVNKGLTRFFFNDSTNANLPVGSKFELWGVRV